MLYFTARIIFNFLLLRYVVCAPSLQNTPIYKHLPWQVPGGGGALPLASHAPVNRPPFLHQFFTECPLFQNFTLNDPLFLFFLSKLSAKSSSFEKFCKSQQKLEKKYWNCPDFVQFHTHWPSFFRFVKQWPFFCKKIVMWVHTNKWCSQT